MHTYKTINYRRELCVKMSTPRQRWIARHLGNKVSVKRKESKSMSEFGIYRSRNGLVFGVCKGIADSRGFSVGLTRILAIAILIFSAIVPFVIGYILLAIFLKPEPIPRYDDWGEEEFDDTLSYSRGEALRSLKNSFDRLDERICRMESRVTEKDFDWEQRLKSS